MPDAISTVDLDAHLAAIAEQGYTILPDVVPPDLVAALLDDLDRLHAELGTRPARNGFEGTSTLRVYNLLAHGPLWQQVPVHPAVLHLVANTIAQARAQGKGVSVCGEMAGDVGMTRLLLGLGLRSFSMHPSQILAVKQQILRCDTGKLAAWAQSVLAAEDPAALMAD